MAHCSKARGMTSHDPVNLDCITQQSGLKS